MYLPRHHQLSHTHHFLQKSHPLYQSFLSSNVIIEGVYDDHDIGMNDADNRLSKSIQQEAQKLLLDFLDIDDNDPRRERDGVYSVHKIDDVMVIMLDTRTHRSPTALIPSIGKWEYPFFAFAASYFRYLSAYFGFVDKHNGTVLDDAQWNWFEQILKSKEFKSSKLVLIVSSTQIFSSNPFFESWGHFPLEKQRLVQLLRESVDVLGDTEPHLLFISGDVHHAELLYGNEEYGPLEVTSSGLTHSLSKMGISKMRKVVSLLSTQITETYSSFHRTNYTNRKSVYYGRNFGVIEIEDDGQFILKIYDAESGENVIEIPLNKNKKCLLNDVLSEMDNDERMRFARKHPLYGLEIILGLGVLCAVVWILCRCIRKQRHSNKPKLH